MPLKVKVSKLDKTQRLLPFCTMNAESATTNCDPENNNEDKASKPSSSRNFICHSKSKTEHVSVMLMSDLG